MLSCTKGYSRNTYLGAAHFIVGVAGFHRRDGILKTSKSLKAALLTLLRLAKGNFRDFPEDMYIRGLSRPGILVSR